MSKVTGKQIGVLIAIVIVTFCAPAVGAFSPPGAWYAALEKPSWTPPAWLFGPVWTALYLLMALAAWMVWRRVGWGKALGWYAIQLGLNAAWTPLFFGAHAIAIGLGVILALWLAIIATATSFANVHRTAGLMLLPYLAWVTFASALNFALWRLNGG